MGRALVKVDEAVVHGAIMPLQDRNASKYEQPGSASLQLFRGEDPKHDCNPDPSAGFPRGVSRDEISSKRSNLYFLPAMKSVDFFSARHSGIRTDTILVVVNIAHSA